MKNLKFALLFLVLFSSTVLANSALDPSVIGLGGRSLAMGGAFAGIAGKPDSVFLNPAALTSLQQWGATSMYSNLLSQVNYVMLGGAQPFSWGVLGAGYLSASIGGIQGASRDPVTGRITFEAGTTNYYNNIYYLTYAQKVMENLDAGLNFKLYSQGFSTGATGNGFDADLGLTYKPLEKVTFGWLQKNFLPAAAGAKVRWSTGAEEGLATSTRLGANYDGGAYNLSFDYLFFPTQSTEPSLTKIGAEWWVSPSLAARIGLDQELGENNLTAGLGYIMAGFAFDYAYHQYGGLSQNTTHTFSLSYGLPKSKEEQPTGQTETIRVLAPADKSIVFKDQVNVEGTVGPEVRSMGINSKSVVIKEQSFGSLQTLQVGKNSLKLDAFNENGSLLQELKVRVLRLQGFKDVPEGYWVRTPISLLAMAKVISGYPNGNFKPEGGITRAELCSVLLRIKDYPAEKKATGFKDVPRSHWASGFIAKAVEEGFVKGYPNKTFKPNGQITRVEGVSVIAKFLGLPAPKSLDSPFSDLPGRHWAVKEVISAKEAGLLQYVGQFLDPKKKMTRAEVVEVLSRSDLLAPQLKETLNFEEGY